MLEFIFDFFVDFLLILPFVLKKRGETRQEWSGFVEEKKARAGHILTKYAYTVVFRTDDGRSKKLRMEKGDFDLYREGKRYVKKAGTYLPDSSSAS